MLKTQHASTLEIDDPDEAIEEIISQIDEDSLLENTIGFLGCNLDYITNGTVKALCEKLPFDVVGSTTIISDVCGEADEYQLSLFVLSSDSLSFAAGITRPLNENANGNITDLYKTVADELSGNATLGFFFAPFMLEVSADDQLRSLNEVTEGIPLFGTVALDYVENVRDPRTVYNGTDCKDCMALVLVSGDIEPKFFVENISEDLFLKQKAIVTSSEGSLLKEVNDMPAIEFLESLGLAKDGMIDSVPLVPLSVDVGDGGLPSARAIFAVTPDGTVACGGDMPENSTLGVGSFDSEDVKATVTNLVTNIAEADNNNCAIIFSCMGRNRALGLDPMHEIERVQAVLGDKIPYLFMYSGGELFPDYINGKPVNKALNDSIIACVL